VRTPAAAAAPCLPSLTCAARPRGRRPPGPRAGGRRQSH
jgi:hypothetical protein